MEATILALVLLGLAIALAGVGLAGLAERLPRNRWLGLRTPAVRENDTSWRAGHRAAGGTLIAAAGPPLLLAAALLASPPDALADWFPVYALVGVITGGLIALASRQARGAVGGSGDGPGPDPPEQPPQEAP
ncbi:MAG: SdpI family protein [Chloroflexota bacterium]